MNSQDALTMPKIHPTLSPLEKKFLEDLAPEDRVAGLAFLRWKEANPLKSDKPTRLRCFLAAFELGRRFQEIS